MFLKKFFLLILFFLVFFSTPVYANELDSSKSSIVMDIDSGRILYENNPDDKRLIASITKIMTATIALENGKLDKKYSALSLVINARAAADSQDMSDIVNDALDSVSVKYNLKIKTFFMETVGMMEEGRGNTGRASRYE